MCGKINSILFVAFLLSLAGCGQSSAPSNSSVSDANELHISYGANTVGTTAYNVIIVHTNILNEHVAGLRVSAEASGGGVDNLKLTEDDVFQISTASNISTWQAVNGEGDFKGEKLNHIFGFIPIYPSYVHIVVPEKSGIRSIQDIKGKRVSVGLKSSGGEVIASSFFNGVGLPYEDFKPYFLAPAETTDGLKDGSLDAAFYASGIPMPAVMELNATEKVRLIPITPEEIRKITEKYPFFSSGIIPGNTYDGMPDDFTTVQGFTIGFIRDSVPEETVYSMAKAIWEHLDDLAQSHASQKDLNPSMIKDGVLPVIMIHPGAARYYKEKGWID